MKPLVTGATEVFEALIRILSKLEVKGYRFLPKPGKQFMMSLESGEIDAQR